MRQKYFSNLLPELAIRASRATTSKLGLSNHALHTYLTETFAKEYGQRGTFLADPVFEATFGWEHAERSMESLSGNLLSDSLVAALDAPGPNCFPKREKPYRHQLEAWETLLKNEPKSVIVTSGTGSGKTECFMVPILDQLIRQYEETRSKLIGVQALFLYPLNALIQSQQERLNAWTARFNGGVRFCLYNGLTPEKIDALTQKKTPNQILDRTTLRKEPPPLLVTNATMLEYMLVRAQDAPIIDQSKGKLQWIVLDEAHTYIGSQAAELTLLLRRVLLAFDVKPEQVRFIATSATIGDDKAAEKLRDFLASMAGVDHANVHVIQGKRRIPELKGGDQSYRNASFHELEAIDSAQTRYQALCANTKAQQIRGAFISSSGQTIARKLSDIRQVINESSENTLKWLDLLTSAFDEEAGNLPFLPLRLHLFHNTLPGLWACSDPECPEKQNTALASPEWPFGKVYTEQRQHCLCGAPVYEIRTCNECNTTFLWSELSERNGAYRLVQAHEDEKDEFALENEEAEDEEEQQNGSTNSLFTPVLITKKYPDNTGEILLDRETLVIDDTHPDKALRLHVIDPGEDPISCPECGATHSDVAPLFRKAFVGAPFLLSEIIPTLLEFCPDIHEQNTKPKERPLRGRRMITFTDSRQGTARLAARLQQEAERNRVRGLIYHYVSHGENKDDQSEIEKLQGEIASLQNAIKAINDKSTADSLKAMIATKEEQLRQKQSGASKAIPYKKIVELLYTNEADVKNWMYQYYAYLDPETFPDPEGKERLARIFVMREFLKRPKRLNSLETMGLVAVCYPKLDAIKSLPDIPNMPDITLNEWRDFLKICLDFYVRDIRAVALPDIWKKWGGQRVSARLLLPPQSKEQPTSYLKRWPQVNRRGRQHRLVRLLSYAFKLNLQSNTDRDRIDMLLRKAWDTLVEVDLLRSSTDGRYLDLEDMAFIQASDGWICPVTKRFLDSTLRGITPYLPNSDAVKDTAARCTEKIRIPKCDLLQKDFDSEEAKLYEIRRWLTETPEIANLRKKGIWSDLNDRILEGGIYYRTAEHSAQLPGSTLKKYEDDFKSGRINLLSCSTTMEMGVDIGGISVVAMNNVPPHPANYLQRAGRAGRRSEPRALSLTLCKNNPHDQHVFTNPLWPFNTALPAPSITLSSPVIVQRHINSFMLATFLKTQLKEVSDLHKLNMQWWLLPKENSNAGRFMAWAECFDETSAVQTANGLRSLLRHTCHEGLVSLGKLLARTASMCRAHCDLWYREFDAIEAELTKIKGTSKETQAVSRALQIQRSRLTDEYLLRELAANNFLPSYGFPTDISTFETLTRDDVQKAKLSAKSRIDNLMRHRDLPSRNTTTALREYAPGSDIVMDGRVYRSAGITLNWHIPADLQAVNEIQNIRQAWRCNRCGSSGNTVSASQISHCPDCGELLKASNTFLYLDPAGFSVDFNSSPHNDVSTPTYIPVQAPWINADGDWLAFANPALGRFRDSTTGTVFNYSSGNTDNGYAICLCCGRAEPMLADGELPAIFQEKHYRLRGAQGRGSVFCEGSDRPFAIKQNLRLGHSIKTDVLELMLYGLDGRPLNDRQIAYSLSVAIRSAVASLLGIESAELGCDTKEIRLDKRTTGIAIVIYDHAAAGYSSSVKDKLAEVFRLAHENLHCSANCDAACQHCLLDYDTRFRVEDLNRHAALAFLSAQWLKQFALERRNAYFGEHSHAEYQSLHEAITRELRSPKSQALHVYLPDCFENWCLADSPLRSWIQRWAALNTPIRLILPTSDIHLISPDDQFILHILSNLDGVSIWKGLPPQMNGGYIAAEVVFSDRSRAWAYPSINASIPAQKWGQATPDEVLVTGSPDTQATFIEPIKMDLVDPFAAGTNTYRFEIGDELDGNTSQFGQRLLEYISNKLNRPLVTGDGEITEILYYDRYLNAPLPVALFLDFLSAIKSAYTLQWNPQTITVEVSSYSDDFSRNPSKPSHNWPTSLLRDAVIKEAFDYCGFPCELHSHEKWDVQHARTLEIRTSDGHTTKIWLDQGFSYWRMPLFSDQNYYGPSFPFERDEKEQAQTVANLAIPIEGNNFPTYLFIGFSESTSQ